MQYTPISTSTTAFDSEAKRILLPTASVRISPPYPANYSPTFQTGFYADPVDSVLEALGVQ